MSPDAAVPPTWNLGPLLDGGGPSDIDRLLSAADALVRRIAGRRGRLAELEPERVAELMHWMAALRALTARVTSYAELRYCADVDNVDNQALLARVQERLTELQPAAMLEAEWAAVPAERASELLEHPCLAFCRRYLEIIRERRRHRLTEAEEAMLADTSLTGGHAWARLLQDLVAELEVVVEGRRHTLDEAFALLSSPEPRVREATAVAVTAALGPGLRTRAFIVNTLLHDKALDDRRRNFPGWLSYANANNGLEDRVAGALIDTVRGRYDIPRRWYALKARLLGVSRLTDYDRWAPVVREDVQINWNDATAVVIDAYAGVSPILGRLAHRIFAGGWIDAWPRPGKHGAAFCAYTVPGLHPYVLCNFTGRRHDVLTLAHEVGHALHALCASSHSMLQYVPPPIVAEAVAVFGEAAALDVLAGACPTPADRLALAAERIESKIVNLFRCTALHAFEDAIHRSRADLGELSPERIGELWMTTQAEMLGDAVHLTQGYGSWWSFIWELATSPGSMYLYVYAQLMASAMHERQLTDPEAFASGFLEMLAAGGTLPTPELTALTGCDMTEPRTWERGLQSLGDAVDLVAVAVNGGHAMPISLTTTNGGISAEATCSVQV